MKKLFTLNLLKYALGLVLILNFSSCSDELELIDDSNQLIQENGIIQDTASKQQTQSSKTVAIATFFNVPELICAGEEAEFCFDAPIKTNLQVQQWDPIEGEWFPIYQKSKSETNPECFSYTFDAEGEYQLRYKIGSGGFTDVTVTVEDCSNCDESFNYVDNKDDTITFNYTPAEDFNNADLVFTFAQGSYVSGLPEGWTAHGQTMQKTMNLVACTKYTWTVTLVAKCSGKSSQSNVWTDFKVLPFDFNEETDSDSNYSKKNENTPNIIFPCN